MDILPDSHPIVIYIALFISPFFQEDTAVFVAAGLAANGVRKTVPLYFTILAGLYISDIWKYWIGWAALKYPRAKAYAEREHITDIGDKINNNLLKALLVGRFVPFARIPTYAACGYFKVPYAKFCFIIALTAVAYVTIVFSVVHFLGEILGDKLNWALPAIALCVLLTIAVQYALKKRRKGEK